MMEQVFRDWGIVLSPNFVFAPEMFLMATLIPISTAYLGNTQGIGGNPIYVDMNDLRRLVKDEQTRTKGIELLENKGFIKTTLDGSALLIGHTKTLKTNQYLFEVSKPVEQATDYKRAGEDPQFKELYKHLNDLHVVYKKHCSVIHRNNQADEVALVVRNVIERTYLKKELVAIDLLKYFDCYIALAQQQDHPAVNIKYQAKEFKTANTVIGLYQPFVLLHMIAFFIDNHRNIFPKTSATIFGFIYHHKDINNKFNERNRSTTPGTGSYV